MKKRIFKIFSITICAMIIVSCTACQSFNEKSNTSSMSTPSVITELNKTFENDRVKITATDIKTITKNDGFIIGIRFIIENISNEDTSLGDIGGVVAFVDDIGVGWASTSSFNKNGESLAVLIAPGKRAMGYYCVNAPKDAKIIEMRLGKNTNFVTFILDVPPVEKTIN